MTRTNAVLLALVLATALPARAQGLPFLHPIFTSDMVVQRAAIVPVRGWTTPGARVELSFAGAQAAATADASGAWRADLGPFPAGGPHTLQIAGPQNITLTNIMVGDVWLCMGQSNIRHPEVEGNEMSRPFFGGATFLSRSAWWTGMSTLREEVFGLTRIQFDGCLIRRLQDV